MTHEDSVTLWITQLKAGDLDAAQPLWDRYFHDLVRLARARLRGAPLRGTDEEDVVLNALDSFFRGTAEGRFPQLSDRESLWPLLVVLTGRKAVDARRHEGRQKRGGASTTEPGDAVTLESILGKEPTPAFAAEVADEIERWLDSLGSEELAAIARWKMEGYTNAEIGRELKLDERTVQRRMDTIRFVLEKLGLPES